MPVYDERSTTVLVIDEDLAVRDPICQHLEEAGFGVLEERNAQAGYDMFLREGADAIVVDLALTGMTGLEIVSAIADEDPEVPVVVLAHKDNIDDILEAMRRGATDYVRKPIADLCLVEAAVKRALERSQHLKEGRRYRDRLELEVRERTADLETRNTDLQTAIERLWEEIGEKRRVQKALLESEDRLALALSATDDALLDWQLGTDSLHISGGLVERLGFAARQLDLDRSGFMALIHPEDLTALNEAVDEHLSGHRSFLDRELRLLRPSGQWHWLLLRGRIVDRDEAGLPSRFAGTVSDIAPRKAADEQLRLVEERLHEAQRLESLGVLAGGLAHDFNNILGTILGNSELLMCQLDPSSSAYESASRVRESVRVATELTGQLLAYAGRTHAVMRPCSVAAVIEELQGALRAAVGPRGRLILDLSPELPLVDGDAAQLKQALLNLVGNAADALQDTGGTVGVRVRSHQTSGAELERMHGAPGLVAGEHLLIEVFDDGQGMDPNTLARVFDPFFSTKFPGRGLGLAAVLGIVRKHRGGIQVSSQPGTGTIFSVYLPVRDRPSQVPASPPTSSRPAWHGSGTVLIVDDDDGVREVTGRMLREIGFEVLSARDGVEGLELFKAHSLDLAAVLLDLTMPRMGGEETFFEMRRIDPHVPVLLCSGYSEQDAETRLALDGLAGFIKKPWGISTLAEKLSATLRGTC